MQTPADNKPAAHDSEFSSPAMYLNGGLIMVAAYNHLVEAAGLLAGFQATTLAQGDVKHFQTNEEALRATMKALDAVRVRMNAEKNTRG